MEECQVSLTGYVATQPESITFDSGASRVKMRVGWAERRRDRLTGEWTDGATSYVTVFCWRKLGTNVSVSLRTGDPVSLKGKLTVRYYEDKDGRRRSEVEVEATSIGHDLSRGVSKFFRVRPETGMTAAEYEAAKAAGKLNPAGNGGTPPGIGQAGTGNGSGAGGGLRFAGGLESTAPDALPDPSGLPAPDDPAGWADEADDTDLDDGVVPNAAEQVTQEAESGEGAEMEAAVV